MLHEKIFISYSSTDRTTANSLAKAVKAAGLGHFLYESDIGWGDNIREKIGEGLRECFALIVVLSSASAKSEWVSYEVGYAVALDRLILPFLTNSSKEIPDFLQGFHHEQSIRGVTSFFKSLAQVKSAPLSSVEQSKTANRVAVVRGTTHGEFMARFWEGTNACAEKHRLMIDEFSATVYDPDIFYRLVHNAIDREPGAIIIDHSTIKANKLKELIGEAVKKNIRVVCFDSILNFQGTVEIHQDPENICRLLKEQLIGDFSHQNLQAKPVEILCVNDPRDFYPLHIRDRKWTNLLKEDDRIVQREVVGKVSEGFYIDAVNSQMITNAVTRNSKIQAIVTMWNEFARVAVTVLKDIKRTDIKVYTVDFLDQDLELMWQENSPLVAAVAVDPYQIGVIAMNAVAQLLKGDEDPKPLQMLPPKLILQSYIIRNEIRTLYDAYNTARN